MGRVGSQARCCLPHWALGQRPSPSWRCLPFPAELCSWQDSLAGLSQHAQGRAGCLANKHHIGSCLGADLTGSTAVRVGSCQLLCNPWYKVMLSNSVQAPQPESQLLWNPGWLQNINLEVFLCLTNECHQVAVGTSQLGGCRVFQRWPSRGLNVARAGPFSALSVSLTSLESSLLFTTERTSEDTYRTDTLIFLFSSPSHQFPRPERGWAFFSTSPKFYLLFKVTWSRWGVPSTPQCIPWTYFL